ncbi:MAG: hypothetical protein IJT65_02415 [Eubacterium sp.]|nr:hypothetical protein [Eubacterium sp.]
MEKLCEFALSKKGKAVTVISGVLTAVICLVMNFVLIPKIESTTNGVRCFDMNFAYGYATAKKFLELLSQEGKQIYLGVQLPLDFVYPIVYTVFFIFILIRLTKKANLLIVPPIILAVLDYTENVLSIVMLKADTLSKSVAAFGSVVTSVKTVLMYLIFLIIIISFILWLKNRKKLKA